MLAACSPVDDLIPGPSGIGSDTDALLEPDPAPHERVVASEAVLAPQLLESS